MLKAIWTLLAVQLVNADGTFKTYGKSKVQWQSCGEIAGHKLECAEIFVPMDHFNPMDDAKKRFSIPMARMLGKNATRTALLNPGGPGSSGINFLTGFGEDLNIMLGESYNLLGFDPRGVANSRPIAGCLPLNTSVISPGKIPEGPLQRVEDYSFNIYHQSGDFYANNHNLARACKDVTGEHGAYITTQQSAADMNDILDAIGQDDLDYFGTSYGSVLGTTYAQMFPDRVHRMAIDGIADPTRYYGAGAGAQYDDADATWRDVLEKCMHESATCELARGFDNVDDLQANITRSIEALREDPVSVYVNASIFGVLRTSDVIHDGILARLYTPGRWPFLARSLAAFIRGDFLTPYLHFYGDVLPRNKPSNTGISSGEEALADYSLLFYLKGDSVPDDQLTRRKLTRREILEQWKPQAYLAEGSDEILPFLGETWLYPKTQSFVQKISVTTKHPLLILSNTFDPVTPMRAAVAVSNIYQGSVLLEQLGPGHCTIAKASKCKAQYLRDYFVHGRLPPVGTKCAVDKPYFRDLNVQQVSQLQATQESAETGPLERALEHLETFDHHFQSFSLRARV